MPIVHSNAADRGDKAFQENLYVSGGRHRLYHFMEAGAERIAVVVPAWQAALFQKYFGVS